MDFGKQRRDTFSVSLRCVQELLNINTLHNESGAVASSHKLSFKYKFCSSKNGNKRQSDFPVSDCLGPGLRLPSYVAVANSRVILRLQWELFYCVWLEIWKSKRFRMSFICWLFDSIKRCTVSELCSHNNNSITREGTGDTVPVYSSCLHKLVHLSLKENEESRPTKRGVTIDVCILLPLRVMSINKDLFWYVYKFIFSLHNIKILLCN